MHNYNYPYITGTQRIQPPRGVTHNDGSFQQQQRGASWTIQQVKFKQYILKTGFPVYKAQQ